MQADHRRLNAPSGGTAPPIFEPSLIRDFKRPIRARQPDEHRKIFLRTGTVPSAAGSAYYEIPPQKSHINEGLLIPTGSSLKINCTVHGPRPLPRNAQFSPNLLLTTHVKFAPFATRVRRGYVRDSTERDLGVHLETALRGVVIGERWPKSAGDVVITVLEGEDDGAAELGVSAGGGKAGAGWGMMNVLAGCITVASAALVDAGIDCVDLVSGGVAALTYHAADTSVKGSKGYMDTILDPAPSEHVERGGSGEIRAACVVGYLQSRDEITEIWMRGDAGARTEELLDEAVKAASMTRQVLAEAVKEAVELKMGTPEEKTNGEVKSTGVKRQAKDIAMTG